MIKFSTNFSVSARVATNIYDILSVPPYSITAVFNTWDGLCSVYIMLGADLTLRHSLDFLVHPDSTACILSTVSNVL